LLAVAQVSSSPLALTLALVIPVVPAVVLGPFLGVLADRFDRRRVMIIANATSMLLFALLAVNCRNLTVILTISGLQSVVNAFFGPARTALLPELVGEEHYLSAASLTEGAYMAMGLVGPAVGGILTGLAGPRASFLFDALTFLVSGACVALVGRGVAHPRRVRSRSGATGELLEGLRAIGRTPALAFTMTLFTVVILVFGGVTVLMADYVCHTLAAGDSQYGLVEAALMAGVVVTTCAAGYLGRRLPKGRVIIGSQLLMGAVTIIFFARPQLPAVVAWAFILGAADGLTNGPIAALMVENTPDHLRGRVMATYSAVARTGALVGTPLAGLAAAALGSGAVLGIMGVVLVAVSVLARLHPTYRMLDQSPASTQAVAQ
jgi:MFS family permease